MPHKLQNILDKILWGAGVIFTGLILGISIQFAIAAIWTGPTSAPPNDNVSSPINTGANQQLKGDFSSHIGSVSLAGVLETFGFKMPTGAGEGKVLTSDASGIGSWREATGGGDNVAILQNRKIKGSDGGSAEGGGVWRNIPLNTEQYDLNSIVDSRQLPISNSFKLDAGTYLFEAVSPFLYTGYFQTRLYNMTDGSAIYGSSGESAPSVTQPAESSLFGIVAITSQSEFRLEYQVYVDGVAGIGLGRGSNFGPEVFSQIKITKLK